MRFPFGGLREKLAGGVMALLVLLSYPTVMSWFERPPIELVGTPATSITADGLWRVTPTIRINEICGSLIWDRSFKSAGDYAIRRAPAVGASEGMGLDAIQGVRSMKQRRKPGVYTSFWDYAAIPGEHGSYQVRVSPGWCPSGWSKSYDLYAVPYDWRGP